MSGRKPDFKVSALQKQTDEKSVVGAAWKNDDGTISVVLNSFVVLHGSKSLLVTLFPRDEDEKK